MAIPFLGTALSAAASLVFRKVTTVDEQSGQQTVKRTTRRGVQPVMWIVVAVVFYQVILWPILNFHFHHYGFPMLDMGVLQAILTAVGVM